MADRLSSLSTYFTGLHGSLLSHIPPISLICLFPLLILLLFDLNAVVISFLFYLFFSICLYSLGDFILSHGFKCHLYVSHSQIYISSPVSRLHSRLLYPPASWTSLTRSRTQFSFFLSICSLSCLRCLALFLVVQA